MSTSVQLQFQTVVYPLLSTNTATALLYVMPVHLFTWKQLASHAYQCFADSIAATQ